MRCGLCSWTVIGVSLAVGRAGSAAPFVRGDVDQSGRLDVSDAVSVLRFLFAGERGLVTCEDAADADDSGVLDASDAVFVLSALFRGGPGPAAPFPDCGEDPTDDALGCEAYEVCRFAFTFFGQRFVADGVFFVVDRSGSMADQGELVRVKQEIIGFIDVAAPATQLGFVFFDRGVFAFPANRIPAEATPETKESASGFVSNMITGSASCVQKGLLAGLELARSSTARRNAIIYAGDCSGSCEGADEATYLAETVEAVTVANGGITRIHAIATLTVPVPSQEKFFQDLASRNGGTYARVNPLSR